MIINQYSEPHPKKHGNHPLTIHINMDSEEHAAIIDHEVNHTPAEKMSVFNQFDLDQDKALLRIKLKDATDIDFIPGFLIALSNEIKGVAAINSTESKLSFHFEGEGESAAGMCLASSGLWQSEFCFSQAEEEKSLMI